MPDVFQRDQKFLTQEDSIGHNNGLFRRLGKPQYLSHALRSTDRKALSRDIFVFNFFLHTVTESR